MTYYRQYRPQSLNELDLDGVRNSLEKIINSGNIPHAFLFAGPKGTGKTSAARILAKSLNCEKLGKNKEPCQKCDQCISIAKGTNIDVIEIDAASHRGIDDVREIREAAKLSAAIATKKIYIIDEAHMLTVEAANSLLKILEEPPSHVVFILATTNPEKLIETILSRTTLVSFTKATREETKRSLARIVKAEKLKINDMNLDKIIENSNGSFRDAVKMLEDFSRGGTFDPGMDFDSDTFIANLQSKSLEALLTQIKKFSDQGGSASEIIRMALKKLREVLLTGGDKMNLIPLIELLIYADAQMRVSPIEELPLEIAVIRWCGDVAETAADPIDETPTQSAIGEITEEMWKQILTKVRPVNASIEALLRAARPVSFEGNKLTLGVYYKFHKERLEEVKHRDVLEKIIENELGMKIRISCVLTEPPVKVSVLTEGSDPDIMKVAEEIFGTN